uniref:ZP domain-containing protein n=1 Tax=Panagrellus redivivus TaxID=6233 RepID=A0A7E4ZWE0_PANRE
MLSFVLVLLGSLLLPQPVLADAPLLVSAIDNGLVDDPVVDCEDTMVSLTFKTKKPFTGRVYVQGLADDDRCSRNFAANNDQSKFSMMIQNGDCTMKRQRVTGSLEGVMLSLTIVVSFHGTFVTRSDRAFRCMCFFKNVHRMSNSIDISAIGTTELLDTARTPSAFYTIHVDGPDGPVMNTGKIGERIYHVWEVEDPEMGFLVHSCYVDDGRGQRFDLLDIDGCAIDPIIQPDVVYQKDLDKAYVETWGYKFSDSSVLNYQCVIETCKKNAGECDGLTPPACGRKFKRDGSRLQRRSIDHTPANEFELVASMEILDEIPAKGISDGIAPRLPTLPAPFVQHTAENYSGECLFPLMMGLSVTVLASIIFTFGAYTISHYRRESKSESA